MTVVEQAREYLSEDRYRIKLHGLVAEEVKRILPDLDQDKFPLGGTETKAEFAQRVKQYEPPTSEILAVQALLAYWGTDAHRNTLVLAPKRIAESLKPEAGVNLWIALRWYPVILLLYAGGIAAVAAGRYEKLRQLVDATIASPESVRGNATLVRAVTRGLGDARNAFNCLPGYERRQCPFSDYVFDLLRPILDELVFLGSEYEAHFDRFEVLLALQYAHEEGRHRGPVGRFGWKLDSGTRSNPLDMLIAEADAEGQSWAPFRAGLFSGSVDRFREVASGCRRAFAELV